MTVPPAKLKAFVAAIKETILDREENEKAKHDGNGSGRTDSESSLATLLSLKNCLVALIQLEIAQRGVLWELPVASSSSSRDDKEKAGAIATKLFSTVQSTAGKPLISENSGFPKPLLAGSAAMAGRIAEKSASLLLTYRSRQKEIQGGGGVPPPPPHMINVILGIPKSSIQKDLEATKRRCQDVQEQRLLSLLGFLTVTEDDTNLSPRSLWIVAEGYFYRAASFQPDVPLYWKRAWDVVSLYQQPEAQHPQESSESLRTWHTIYALEQLHRVASSKQNVKRAAELSLRLTEACLDAISATIDTLSSTPTFSFSTTEKTILEAFCAPYRALEPLDQPEALQKARKQLDSVDPSTLESQDDDILLRVLRVELPMAEEQFQIDTLVQEELVKLQRRSTNSKGTNKNSNSVVMSASQTKQQEKQLHSKVKDQCLAKEPTPIPPSWENAVFALQETAQSIAVAKAASPNPYKSRVWNGLTHIINRSVECMRVKLQSSSPEKLRSEIIPGWEQIASFLRPLWESSGLLNEEEEENEVIVDTLKVAFLLVPSISWMTLNQIDPDHQQQLIPTPVMEQTSKVLHQWKEQALERVTKAKSSSTVSAAGSTRQEQEAWTLQLACLSTQALLILRLEGGNDSLDNEASNNARASRKRLSEAVLKLLETKKQVQNANESALKYGTFYLALLVCWNGLNESPFPFLTFKEALLLLSEVRQMFRESSRGNALSRSFNSMELLWLDLCEAHVSLHPAGRSKELYELVVNKVSSKDVELEAAVVSLIRAHCLQRLAADGNTLNIADSHVQSKLEMAREAAKELDALAKNDNPLSVRLYPWHSPNMFRLAIEHQVMINRRQIADCFIQLGKLSEARSILEKTVTEFPKDAKAALAFGSFLLRMCFFDRTMNGQGEETMTVPPKGSKEAQAQLLKAAKLDGTNADAFALIGYWYESHGDTKRSIGFYSKALALAPAHPVAGRGLLRLVPAPQLKKALDGAVAESHTTSVNGWAWQAVGTDKVRNDADYELAVVALLQAARARDIENPQSDPLAIFYSGPANPTLPNKKAAVSILSLIAQCYRFLGRYTASLRMYYTALNETGIDGAEGSLLCACGQIEMELGLFREAAERFTKALKAANTQDDGANGLGRAVELTATLGLGVALLSVARVEVQDGKAGAALECLRLAIQRCNSMDSASSPSVSVQKLRGDLHSFGAVLPIRAFINHDKGSVMGQIEFVSEGEVAYRKAEEYAVKSGLESLQASLVCDLAVNILLRAQLLSVAEGLDGIEGPSAKSEFAKAEAQFCRALAMDGGYSPAWCGLGCATLENQNPLLSQHAFCRSIELDPLAPDPYANLGFLYTIHSAAEASQEVSETLTQVADTPMMWINRALLLEKEVIHQEVKDERLLDQICRIADAYRASLQVASEPVALIGCTASGLIGIDSARQSVVPFSEWDIKNYSDEYSTSTAVNNISAKIIQQSQASKSMPLDRKIPKGLSDTSFPQNVILEPQKAAYWLKMAKQVLSKSGKMDERQIQSANAAASKAVLILKHQLEEPAHATRQENNDSEYVNSNILSESLIVKSYTDSSRSMQGFDGAMVTQTKTKDLQHALLISPWNKIARAAFS